jgi:hypothetical protein
MGTIISMSNVGAFWRTDVNLDLLNPNGWQENA